MNKKTIFWIGWTIWICMVVFKVVMVFSGDTFQWDPMFLILPLAFIITGSIPEHNCNHQKEDEKEDKE